MCLSSVYKQSGDENVFMLKNIAKVEVNGKMLAFTDLFGGRTEFEGEISDIDLLENIILVKE